MPTKNQPKGPQSSVVAARAAFFEQRLRESEEKVENLWNKIFDLELDAERSQVLNQRIAGCS